MEARSEERFDLPAPGRRSRSRAARLGHRMLALTALLGLLMSGMSATWADAPASTSPVRTQAAATGAGCVDLLVVSVDGNTQGKPGKPGDVARRVTNRLKKRGKKEGRSVAVRTIVSSTRHAGVLVSSRSKASVKAITPKGRRLWKRSIGSMVKDTRALLKTQVAACPEQQIVLVGYAQGAGVVHKVLQRAGAAQRQKIVGAVTVADPWRVKKSSVGKPVGAPPAARSSVGMLTKFTKGIGDVPKRTDNFRVVSVCTRGDLVCNPNKMKARDALKRHNYRGAAARKALRAAADTVWSTARLSPVPMSERIDALVGEAISRQLRVSGGSATGAPAVWTATSLPSGVSLSADGHLRGALDDPGSYTVSYTVAGRAPSTMSRTGTARIEVHENPGVVSAGGQTSCQITRTGEAWCWGANDHGQVGDGTRVTRAAKTAVPGRNWSQISTGGSFTCAVKSNGTLWCWGLNNLGQMGGSGNKAKLKPKRVGKEKTWVDVAVSWHHACAIRSNGTAWCWGSNSNGQLGDKRTARRSQEPVRVAGGYRWTKLAAGGWHTCGLTRNGAARCWGANTLGQIGDGTTKRRPGAKKVAGGHRFTDLSATWSRTCGVTTRGTIMCWGDNTQGELGNGTRTNSNVPVQVRGSQTWEKVSTDQTHTCGVDDRGRVWCWGDNRYGQLGVDAGTTTRSTTPVATGRLAVGGILSLGWMHACAGQGECWGAGDRGQLGTGKTVPVPMPSRTAPTWPQGSSLTVAQVNNWSAKKIAKRAVKSRPAVSDTAKTKTSATFNVMTFNVLGTQHTAPGGSRPEWAPGRARTEWGRDLIERQDVSLVGMSEPQPDQIDSYNQALRGEWTIYPGRTMGYSPAPQSVMWRDADWEYVWANTVSMPFMRGQRPQPLVRLRHKATGREIYWINAHLSPGKMQADRDKGIKIIKALVKQLKGDKLPILVTGDLNEHAVAFRRIACGSGMVAAVGGVSSGGTCTLPRHMRVDWIFGQRGTFANTVINTSAQVRRTTDHAVVSSTFTVR